MSSRRIGITTGFFNRLDLFLVEHYRLKLVGVAAVLTLLICISAQYVIHYTLDEETRTKVVPPLKFASPLLIGLLFVSLFYIAVRIQQYRS